LRDSTGNYRRDAAAEDVASANDNPCYGSDESERRGFCRDRSCDHRERAKGEERSTEQQYKQDRGICARMDKQPEKDSGKRERVKSSQPSTDEVRECKDD